MLKHRGSPQERHQTQLGEILTTMVTSMTPLVDAPDQKLCRIALS